MNRKPVLIKIGLLGIKRRNSALAWFYASIFGSLALAAATTITFAWVLKSSLPVAVLLGLVGGSFFCVAALWYRSCIRWMDENAAWED